MFEGHLADLDELVLSVRDRNSREYIGEAAANYRSRCFRSAVSSTWVAVTYDIISKIRELSLQADKQARVFIERVDKAIGQRVANPTESKKQLQAIENELLDVAHNDFELLSDHELRDMQRLQEDRHLCAHPAFAGNEALFQPSSEQVRAHIVQAINCLLLHPPVQGKAALQRLKRDLLQMSFPTTQSAVSDFLDERYLKHMKSGLVDNFISVLVKAIVKQTETDLIGKDEPMLMCLVAIQRRHGQRFSERMRQELTRVTDGGGDEELRRAMKLLKVDGHCWSWLSKPAKIQITEVVRNYSFDPQTVDAVSTCLEVDELRPIFADRVSGFTTDQKAHIYRNHPHPTFIDDAIAQYIGAAGFRDAEGLFEQMIRPFMPAFRAEHVNSILDGARKNSQIYCASKSPLQMTQLFEQSSDLLKDTSASWNGFLDDAISKYDSESKYYSPLLTRMTETGVRTVPAINDGTAKSSEQT